MADSFFSSRNGIDQQADTWPLVVADGVLDATTRRLVTLEGPNKTAARLYRLADICAARHVAPYEFHQRAGEVEKGLTAIKPEPRPRWWKRFTGPFSLWSYALGYAVGVLSGNADKWWPF